MAFEIDDTCLQQPIFKTPGNGIGRRLPPTPPVLSRYIAVSPKADGGGIGG